MKKRFILLLIIVFAIIWIYPKNSKSIVVGEYKEELALSFNNSVNEAYAIGINKDNMPIFKDHKRALSQAQKDYKEGFKAIRKEFKLLPLNRFNWEPYKTYGWQLTTGSEKAKEQGRMISNFFDIYENSFK
ncbi:MAG: hypothetical protein GX666_04275 [Tissierellia bacterium]|nr:hypothetical protein [Tissierellia bacterium]